MAGLGYVIALAAVPVTAWFACWLTLAFRKPYSLARPLGVRWMKLAAIVTNVELVTSMMQAVIVPGWLPLIVVRTAFALALGLIPALLLALLIDTLRGGVPASQADVQHVGQTVDTVKGR